MKAVHFYLPVVNESKKGLSLSRVVNIFQRFQNMPRAYSTPLVSMQSSHAFPFSEVEVPRSSALSLNVPLREEEAEPIIQLPTQVLLDIFRLKKLREGNP